MLEPRVSGTGINHRCEAQLVNPVQTLEQRMLHDAVEQSARYLDEPENGVVDDLGFFHDRRKYGYFDCKGTKKVTDSTEYHRNYLILRPNIKQYETDLVLHFFFPSVIRDYNCSPEG